MSTLAEVESAVPGLSAGGDVTEVNLIASAAEAFQAYDREEAERAKRLAK